METFNKYYTLPIEENYGMFYDAKGNHILDIVCEFPEDKPLKDLLLAKLNGKETDLKITKLVKYKPTKIFTHDKKVLISIRGWGRLQKLPNGDKIQDEIGLEIANLINENHTKNKPV